MPEFVQIPGVRLAAVAASVPDCRIGNNAFAIGDEAVRKFERMVGCRERRHAKGLITHDLALDSALALRTAGHWDAAGVGACLYVGQTYDYAFPATACVMHGELGLKPSCLAYDVRMGCSAFTCGLVQAASLISSGVCERVLLVGGDCLSHVCAESDNANRMLFGDAGFAAVVESAPDGRAMTFRMGTDGGSAKAIYSGWGGFAKTISGAPVPDPWLHMDGLAVYKFASTVVPSEIKAFCAAAGHEVGFYDTFCLHQANAMIMRQIAMLSGFPASKLLWSIEQYGNTSPASIPLTLCANADVPLGKTMMVGFGVGLSWGIAACDLSDCVRIPVREVEDRS